MKRILITFALVLIGLTLFGQIPRIRLNQVQKDTVWGSVLISSPVDSNLTYSRDFYIGADTSLNFYGTILVAGGGGGGSFVTTAILSDSLSNYILKLAGFGGDVTGTYDNIVVVDDSHNHVISNVDGLQTALDGKSNTGHTHVISDISGLQTALDGKLTSVNIGVGLSGSGTTGSPLVVDTAVYIVSKNFYFANLPAGGGGTVTSVAIDAGTGISVSGSPITTSGTITVTNAAPDQTVSITGAGINAVTGTYPNFTITGTEVDASVTNEGSLSVGAGGANSSDIVSNTSGSTNVTIAGGSNVTVTESGSTITIASTGGGGSSFNNLTETADTVFVAKYLNVDTATLYVDADNNIVGINTADPDATAISGLNPVVADVNGTLKGLHFAVNADSTLQVGGSYNAMRFTHSARNSGTGNLFATFIAANDTPTNSSGFFFQRQRGTIASPSGVLAEDDIAAINFAGALTTGASATATARIIAIADANATSTEAPTRLGFVTGGSASTRAERLTIKSDGKVGIGTSTPSEALDVEGNIKAISYTASEDTISYPTAAYAPLDFNFEGRQNNLQNMNLRFTHYSNFNNSNSTVFLRRARGTLLSPLGVLNNDLLGSLYFSGSRSDGNLGFPSAAVQAFADADADSTTNPARISFSTGQSFSTLTERLTIKSDGKIGMGTTAPSFTFHVAAPTGSDRVYLTGTLNDGNELSTAIVANSREAAVGLYKPTDRNPSGFVLLESRDGDNVYLYTDSTAANNVFVSTTQNNVGTATGGTLVGSQVSDIRLKTDLGAFPYGLEDVLNLNPVQFAYKEDYTMKRNIGFYAQEVLPIIPEAVYNTNEIINEGEPTRLGMQYVFLVPVLTKAIQEQQAIIESQKTEIDNLKTQYESLLQRIITLENK